MSGQSPQDSRSQILSLIRLDDTHQRETRPQSTIANSLSSQYLDFLKIPSCIIHELVGVCLADIRTFIPDCKLTLYGTLTLFYVATIDLEEISKFQQKSHCLSGTVTRWLVISGCE